ncbi:MAG: hypothetical protein KIH64_018265 [Mycobacterium sp.]|nr:hypothetical protein [Mycobacterium sp.]
MAKKSGRSVTAGTPGAAAVRGCAKPAQPYVSPSPRSEAHRGVDSPPESGTYTWFAACWGCRYRGVVRLLLVAWIWVVDRIIAASAELAGLYVLHVDKDFETIAALTGQPTTRLDYAGANFA